MRKLVLTSSFQRAYDRRVKNNKSLQNRIDSILRQMQDDVFAPMLGTHKLSGELLGLWACACGYDCRIVFSLEIAQQDDGLEIILLIDIGSHDQVY